MKPTVYVETTIISYLVGWLSRNDLQVAAHQELTRRWWTSRRSDFEVFASTVVFDEAGDGDPDLAAERLRFLHDVTLLRVPDHAHKLKRELLLRTQIPARPKTMPYTLLSRQFTAWSSSQPGTAGTSRMP
ncbi:MAG: hypothetical protein ACXW5U_09370 [Thermoanaerobaculia bacterium]